MKGIIVDAVTGDRYRAGKRLWSRDDDRLLRREYPHTPTAQLAARLRRSTKAVYTRAKRLGIGKSPEYLASPAACRLRRGDNFGAAHRFPKGHVPANKGLRRPGWSAGRMRETQFRKGELSGVAAARCKPIGATRTLDDGYLMVKVANTPGVPWCRNWMMVHVLLWEEHHGPLPPGHVVVFRNGDRSDIRLENLELVSRRALMARNSYHNNLPPELAKLVQLRGALSRQINRRKERP